MAEFNFENMDIDNMDIQWLPKQGRKSAAPITYSVGQDGMASLRLSKDFMEKHLKEASHVAITYHEKYEALLMKVANPDADQEVARAITRKKKNGTDVNTGSGTVNFKIDNVFPSHLEKVEIPDSKILSKGNVIIAALPNAADSDS